MCYHIFKLGLVVKPQQDFKLKINLPGQEHFVQNLALKLPFSRNKALVIDVLVISPFYICFFIFKSNTTKKMIGFGI